MVIEKGANLLSMQETAKTLGITKKDVQSLVDSEQLKSVQIREKVYITKASIADLLHIDVDGISGGNASGYPEPEELKSQLTKKDKVDNEKGVTKTMAYSGCVSSLKDGRFMVQTYITGKKREGVKSKSFRNEVEAQEYLRRKLNELNGVVAIQNHTAPNSVAVGGYTYTGLTFEQYALNYLRKGGSGRASSMTLENYRRGLKPLNDIIGKKPIADLTKDDLTKAFTTLSSKYADGSLQKTYTAVKLILSEAFEEGDIPCDITRRLSKPKSRVPKKTKDNDVFSKEDLQIIFEKSREWSTELYAQMTLLACTGMRPEEMRALEWSDFDPKKKTIDIRQAIVHKFESIKTMDKQPKSNEEISVTKSDYSRRTLQLSDLAVHALKEWKQELRLRKNWAQAHSKFIFPTRDGNFKTSSGCESVLKRFRRANHLEYMNLHFYKFRHTMCTNLILDGQPIPVIQRILGENTTDVIMNIYTHVTQSDAKKATADYYKKMNATNAEIANSMQFKS